MRKPISEMTEKEILRQQLELLTERSKRCPVEELAKISEVVLSIATYLKTNSSEILSEQIESELAKNVDPF